MCNAGKRPYAKSTLRGPYAKSTLRGKSRSEEQCAPHFFFDPNVRTFSQLKLVVVFSQLTVQDIYVMCA